jgi:two-component sensor histidine kinase
VTAVEAGPHFQELCHMLRSLLPQGVRLSARCSGTIPGDAVESLTLIANELVTNAAKHAFAERDGGEIELGFRQQGAGWRLWIHDNGRGLPPDGPIFWPAAVGDARGTAQRRGSLGDQWRHVG